MLPPFPLTKPLWHPELEEATVITSDASQSNTTWTTCGCGTPLPINVTTGLVANVPIANCCNLLANTNNHDDTSCTTESLDRTCVAVDLGASNNFGNIKTTGTNRQPTRAPVTMAGATGDCQTSIHNNTFDLPLPPASLNCHVFPLGDVQRPLLWSVRSVTQIVASHLPQDAAASLRIGASSWKEPATHKLVCTSSPTPQAHLRLPAGSISLSRTTIGHMMGVPFRLC